MYDIYCTVGLVVKKKIVLIWGYFLFALFSYLLFSYDLHDVDQGVGNNFIF